MTSPIPPSERPPADRVERLRRFNRFYTRRIGVLDARHLDTPFSLAEVRVLYELAHRDEPTASDLIRELGLDAGYLSRMLRAFESKSLIQRRRSPNDGRESLISLTDAGRVIATELNDRARDAIADLLQPLSDDAQTHIVDAMQSIEQLLDSSVDNATALEDTPPYILRSPRAGDLGWVVYRHGVLYWQEYGWDARFEALVADVVAHFVQHFDPARDRCWIAERNGEIVGSIFLVRQSDSVAKLRLLYVEPSVRGLGIGHRLVDECIRFAREVGYSTITLWTNDVLHAARKIYQRAGFQLVQQEPHALFGEGLIGQTWELTL